MPHGADNLSSTRPAKHHGSRIAYIVTATGWFLLGAPWDCSGTGRGEDAAPAALRAAGLGRLVNHDVGDADTVIDSTLRDKTTGVLALPETARAARRLSASLIDAWRDLPGWRPLVVGGDCSILLGIFTALRTTIGPASLWFVDSHPDYLDGRSSSTGETADMDLAVLTGIGAEPLVSLAGAAPMVAPDAVVLLGHRTSGLDAASAAEVARMPAALRRVDARRLCADPAAAGRAARDWLANHGPGTWLHIDLDVLNQSELPAVTYPQPGGPSWDQLAAALESLAGSPQLLGVSVADFRPDLDPAGAAAARIIDLLERVLPA